MNRIPANVALTKILLGCFVALFTQSLHAQDWPQWRGPRGDGHTTAKAPLKWADENVAWATALPGVGQSSPVVWGDRIYLTAAEKKGAERLVLCVDKASGKLLWQQTAWKGDPEAVHPMNPWASATCVTDGKHVYAFFGAGGLHCYTADGKHVWSRELGVFENPWGTAASPVIVGDLLIQNCDAENDSFLGAFNKDTGVDVWRTPRERLRGWSTPLLVETDAGVDLLLNGETGVRGYNAKTGKELWFRKGDTGRGTPTVTPTGDGLFVVVNGRAGDMFAVRRDGTEVWRIKRTGRRDLPSPAVIGDRLLVVSLRPGLLTAYDVASGEVLGNQRLKGSFSASPIVVSGHALIPNEDGDVFVLKPTKAGAEIVAVNSITCREDAETFRASLTPLTNALLLRSTRTLYMIRD